MESAHVTGSASDDASATASRRNLSYNDKGIIKCVSTAALSSCGIGNTVEGFINHENLRVDDALTFNVITKGDKALSALYKLQPTLVGSRNRTRDATIGREVTLFGSDTATPRPSVTVLTAAAPSTALELNIPSVECYFDRSFSFAFAAKSNGGDTMSYRNVIRADPDGDAMYAAAAGGMQEAPAPLVAAAAVSAREEARLAPAVQKRFTEVASTMLNVNAASAQASTSTSL